MAIATTKSVTLLGWPGPMQKRNVKKKKRERRKLPGLKEMQKKVSLESADLVRVISPSSLEKMNIVGIITDQEKDLMQTIAVWVPDIGREICFHESQLERIS